MQSPYGSLFQQCQYIQEDQYLKSDNGKYFLYLNPSGDLKICRDSLDGEVIWSTNTAGQGEAPYHLKITIDGKLNLFDSHRTSLWTPPKNKDEFVNKAWITDEGVFYAYGLFQNQIFASDS